MSVPSSHIARMAAMAGRQSATPHLPETCQHCGMPVKKGNETREECPTYVIHQAAAALEAEAKEKSDGDEPATAAP